MTSANTPKPLVVWPIALMGAPAFVAIWSGWVGIGRMTGFGVVHPLPGIWDALQIDSAITLPVGVEAYAGYGMYVWLSGRAPARAAEFARTSAIGSLVVGALGQIAYHLMAAAGFQAAPWWITMLVACLPVAVFGMGAALIHLVRNGGPREDHETDRGEDLADGPSEAHETGPSVTPTDGPSKDRYDGPLMAHGTDHEQDRQKDHGEAHEPGHGGDHEEGRQKDHGPAVPDRPALAAVRQGSSQAERIRWAKRRGARVGWKGMVGAVVTEFGVSASTAKRDVAAAQGRPSGASTTATEESK